MSFATPPLGSVRMSSKRVVILHHNGLHRIVGVFDPSVHTLRPYVEFDQGGEKIAATLKEEQKHFVIYTEIDKKKFSLFGKKS
jgi:hypothetical protein